MAEDGKVTLTRVTKCNANKKAMLEALEKTRGVVTDAAKMVGIDRKTHYQWMKEDPDYAAATGDTLNAAIDFAESKLHTLIENGDTAATIFLLKTIGKNRGYTERQELEHKHDDNTLRIIVERMDGKK
jgi:hypothetical protein